MTANELIYYLQKVINAGKGDSPIIIILPYDGQELKIKDAIFLEHFIDTYESTSEYLELTTLYSYN